MTLDVNFGPLSDCRDKGRPNLGIIFVRRIWATMRALLFVVGNVFTHPKKVSTRTKRYLNRRTGGICVSISANLVLGGSLAFDGLERR